MLNTITVTNTWAQFNGPNLAQARDVLSYKQKGYIFTQAYKRGFWDGRVYMVDRNGRLPAGLVPELIERLEQEGIEVEVTDNRPLAANTNDTLAHLPHWCPSGRHAILKA